MLSRQEFPWKASAANPSLTQSSHEIQLRPRGPYSEIIDQRHQISKLEKKIRILENDQATSLAVIKKLKLQLEYSKERETNITSRYNYVFARAASAATQNIDLRNQIGHLVHVQIRLEDNAEHWEYVAEQLSTGREECLRDYEEILVECERLENSKNILQAKIERLNGNAQVLLDLNRLTLASPDEAFVASRTSEIKSDLKDCKAAQTYGIVEMNTTKVEHDPKTAGRAGANREQSSTKVGNETMKGMGQVRKRELGSGVDEGSDVDDDDDKDSEVSELCDEEDDASEIGTPTSSSAFSQVLT